MKDIYLFMFCDCFRLKIFLKYKKIALLFYSSANNITNHNKNSNNNRANEHRVPWRWGTRTNKITLNGKSIEQ